MPVLGIRERLDPRSLQILKSVAGGSCVLVDPDDRNWRNPKSICERVVLCGDDARLIAGLILDDRSWLFAQKRCLPKSTALFYLNSPHGNAKLLVGVHCRDWVLKTDANELGGFFDPVDDQVRGILKRTFPDFASADSRAMWRAGIIEELKNRANNDRGGIE